MENGRNYFHVSPTMVLASSHLAHVSKILNVHIVNEDRLTIMVFSLHDIEKTHHGGCSDENLKSLYEKNKNKIISNYNIGLQDGTQLCLL